MKRKLIERNRICDSVTDSCCMSEFSDQAAIGVVGLGVMGSQLSLNLAQRCQTRVAGFDLDADKASAVATLAKVLPTLLTNSLQSMRGQPVCFSSCRPTLQQDQHDILGEGSVVSFTSLETFVAQLALPRKVILLVPAGNAIESAISALLPLLNHGDAIVDMGNEWFELTEERFERASQEGILYMGCGLSGGSEGARHGPCLMPGGSKAAWDMFRPYLEV